MIPTPDGGEEHTAAVFDYPAKFLRDHRISRIRLYPPQYFLLDLVSKFFTGPPSLDPLAPSESHPPEVLAAHYQDQRERLLKFIHTVPTSMTPYAEQHRTSQIPWAHKVMSPHRIGITRDNRAVLAVNRPGLELQGTGRGGDYERVILARFSLGGATDIEVRSREEARAELAEKRREELEIRRIVYDRKDVGPEARRLRRQESKM